MRRVRSDIRPQVVRQKTEHAHTHTYIQRRTHSTAHSHGSEVSRRARRQWGNATLTHTDTHTCSQTHTGLALFWHAALWWALWGFRGIGRCWLCREPAEPLHSHSCLPHHLRRASNHCGKSGLGRAEDISFLSSSSSISPPLPSLHLLLCCTLQQWGGGMEGWRGLLPLVQGGCHNSHFFWVYLIFQLYSCIFDDRYF